MANNKMTQMEEEVLVKPSVVEKYGKQMLFGIGGLVVLIILGMWYKNHAAESEAAANDAIVVTQKSLNQQDSLSMASMQKAAESVIDNHSGTDAANLAHLYAGIALYNQGKYEAALEEFKDFDACGDQTISAQAEAAKGDCQACLQKYDDAVKSFKKAAEMAGSENLKVMNLIKAGEICEFALNDNAKALECYKKASECKAAYQVQNGQVEAYIARASNK